MPHVADSSENQIKERSKAAFVSLGVGVTLCCIKLLAWYWTGSSAIMSDALESFINVASALVALAAVAVSARPADDTHPYGHGKIEFFSSGVEGAMILLAGLAICVHSVYALATGVELHDLGTGLSLVVGAGLANLALGLYLIRTGKASHSEALVASGHHVLSDVWTSVGIIAGVALVFVTGMEWLDPLCAIAAGLWIFRSGYLIVRRAIGMLMDEADPVLLGRIAGALSAARRDGWIVPHRLRAWRSGATVRVDFHLIMPFYWSLERTHGEEHALHDALKGGLSEPMEVIVHTEPCFPACCHICGVADCPVRQESRSVVHDWTSGLLEGELKQQTGGHGHPDQHFAAQEKSNIS